MKGRAAVNEFERLLESHLPRPPVDDGFHTELLDQLLTGRSPVPILLLEGDGERRRRYYVGSAVVGAAALAAGAALGWMRFRGPQKERAA